MFLNPVKSFTLSLSLLLSLTVTFSANAQEKRRVIIDADTGNEVDDLYALVRALIEPSWEVIGLNATQWQASQWAIDKTIENSHRLNSVLLSYLKMDKKVTLNRGAEGRLYDWGNKSRPSAASAFIIREAHKMKDDKLTVVALGALTNVASAIIEDPTIVPKIALHWLGTDYDFEKQTMSNLDFNSVMDIQAVYAILNSAVELHLIPNNEASRMQMGWVETSRRFKGKHDLLDFILDRWFNHLDGGRSNRTIWDLALIEAIIRNDLTQKVQVRTSKEKGDRVVWMYRNINDQKMREDFYFTTLKHLKVLK